MASRQILPESRCLIVQDYNQAFAFASALTGNRADSEIIDWRAIHDTNKAVAAIPFRDTLANAWSSIVHYNNQGYGIFATIARMDGNGRELSNVQAIRSHYVDLDNLSAQQNYERATQWTPAPSFAVQSSPSKFHVYWPVVEYAGNDRFQVIQRKLRQFFDGDGAVIDAARVMRLPGTLHLKDPSAPHLVICWSLAGFGVPTTPEALESALAAVNVIDGGGSRHDLGEAALAAPSLDWIRFALGQIDPNELERGDWISATAAIKQAGWSLITQEQQLFDIWSEWCARYVGNDPAENWKQWNSIRQTEVGWPAIIRRVPALIAYEKFNKKMELPAGATEEPTPTSPASQPMPAPPELDCSGEMLTDQEQRVWFKDCVLIERMGEIMVPSGRTMNATKFNAAYGGKKFIVDQQGKITNEPWQAATRSTLWTVPHADHIRFIPSMKYAEIITDDLGRKGVNTYRPSIVERREGDPSPFLRHLEAILPVESDRKILLDYFAHNAQFPGYKIPWSPVIQSVEGVGKGILKSVMEHMVGKSHFYTPKAQELVNSGSRFNAWMRGKLFILVDEIRVDEKRDLIEILKPMISEKQIEIQSKGIDQEIEDNYSNWLFFTNFKDAIPVNKNARRFGIFYSAIQSMEDLLIRGMDKRYFDYIYSWTDYGGGKEIMADYLLKYPIEQGSIPMRAPDTSSTAEALKQSRGPIEQLIMNAVEDGLPGFRGGWISTIAVMNRLKMNGGRMPAIKTIISIIEHLQYYDRGRAHRPYFPEDKDNRTHLFNVLPEADPLEFGPWQGYE